MSSAARRSARTFKRQVSEGRRSMWDFEQAAKTPIITQDFTYQTAPHPVDLRNGLDLLLCNSISQCRCCSQFCKMIKARWCWSSPAFQRETQVPRLRSQIKVNSSNQTRLHLLLNSFPIYDKSISILAFPFTKCCSERLWTS